MKKKKEKAIVKESRKVAKKELTEQILGALRSVTINFTKDFKKTEKLITKQAKQLAKKLGSIPVAKTKETLVPVAKTKEKVITKKEDTPA